MRSPKEVVEAFYERLWNGRELALAPELVHPDCRTHQLQSGTPGGSPRGPDVLRNHVAEWIRAFPDLRFHRRQTVAEGDRVVTELVVTGTHEGRWLGIPPTGAEVSVDAITIHRIEDGKIIEDWVLVDSYSMFEQLGLLLPKPDLIGARR